MSFLLRSLFCIAVITIIAGENESVRLREDITSATRAGATSAYALLCEGREAKCLAKAAEIAASLDRQGIRSVSDAAKGRLLPSQDTLTRGDRAPASRAP